MNVVRLTFWVLLAVVIWGTGCSTPKPKPVPDPLAGWKVLLSRESEKLNQAIKGDYRDYIQKLPPGERHDVMESAIWFFEDGTGQHAVKIEIPLNGIYREHVLIYDKDDKRIKVIIYSGGRFAS